MSQARHWFNILSEAAGQRNIDVSLLQARNLEPDKVSQLESWVKNNLNENLLTSEEHTIWDLIEGRESVRKDFDDSAQSVDIPSNHEALKHAIERLESSTRGFRSATNALECQRPLFETSSNYVVQQDHPAWGFEHQVQRDHQKEKQQILFMNDELESRIQESTSGSQESIDKCIKAIQSTVMAKLRADDRILSTLNGVTSREYFQDANSQSKNQFMLAALHRGIVLGLKTNLDLLYLRELGENYRNSDGSTSPEIINETQKDIQSLYSEVEAVALMLVEHEHGAKLKVLEERLEQQAAEVRAQNGKKIIEKLEILSRSAAELARNYELLRDHRTALNEITRLYLQTRKQTVSERPRVDTQRKDEGDCTSALLRHIGVPINPSPREKSTEQNLRQLSEVLAQKNHNSSTHTVGSISHSVHSNRYQLEPILAESRNHLLDAAESNLQLDNQIALVKSRFEQR